MTPGVLANHEISLAVWDLPSPVVVGRRATLKVGVSCPFGCSLTGTAIEIRDEQGATIGGGRIGSELWPGSMALHWAELDVAVPHVEGDQTWRLHATVPDAAHAHLEGIVRVLASKPPEHRVTIDVIEEGSGRPLGDVELRVGAFRATTNDKGRAHVEVPGGTYDVHAWKQGYDLLSSTASVVRDMTLPLAIAVTLSPDQPYWM